MEKGPREKTKKQTKTTTKKPTKQKTTENPTEHTLQKHIAWQCYRGHQEQLLTPEHNCFCTLWTNVPQHTILCYIKSYWICTVESLVHMLYNYSHNTA